MATVAQNRSMELPPMQVLREASNGANSNSSNLVAVVNQTISTLMDATTRSKTTTASTPMEDLGLPIEESSRTSMRPMQPPQAPPLWSESTEAEKSAALAMVGCLLAAMAIFTLAYVVYQRYTCKVSRRHKTNGAAMRSLPMKQSATAMTIAGEHHALMQQPAVCDAMAVSSNAAAGQSQQHQSVAKKWYNSAILQYADQSPKI